MRHLIGLVGLLFLNCEGAPDYKVEVHDLPMGTARLEVAAYVQGALAKNTPTLEASGPRDSFTFGLNLGRALAGDATISVAARREDGCLLAVGTGMVTGASSGTTSVFLPLIKPEPGISDTTCKAQPPIILSAIRRQEGPLTNMHSTMLLYGWGFPADAQVSLKSPFPVQCDAANVECAAACPTVTSCAFKDSNGGTVNIACRTDCTVKTEVVHVGPALMQLNLDSTKNLLQEGTTDFATASGPIVRSVDLLQLLSGPLNITVSDSENPASSARFSETTAAGVARVGS